MRPQNRVVTAMYTALTLLLLTLPCRGQGIVTGVSSVPFKIRAERRCLRFAGLTRPRRQNRGSIDLEYRRYVTAHWIREPHCRPASCLERMAREFHCIDGLARRAKRRAKVAEHRARNRARPDRRPVLDQEISVLTRRALLCRFLARRVRAEERDRRN